MSLRLEMLQVARLAPKLLGDSAGLVHSFLLSQQNDDGGFKDRSGQSDLYYTVFGVDALAALEVQGSRFKVQSSPAGTRLEQYVRTFRDGENLDFVHLCCLARAWAQCRTGGPPALVGGATSPSPHAVRDDEAVAAPIARDHPAQLLRRIESYRSKDGGYNQAAASEAGSVYGCFLAFGAYQDMKAEMPAPAGLLDCLHALETTDGAWSNSVIRHPASGIWNSTGSTNATAAAITLLRNLGAPIPSRAAEWLLARCHPQGGFLAAPDTPIPDLLSTATALHALAGMQVPLDGLREKCLDFIDSLWTNEGSFHGHWAEDILDCEYTFYGLLALGHLSL